MTLVRSRTVANVDSIGLVVFRWIQCSAGKSKKHSSALGLVGDLRGRLRPLGAVLVGERPDRPLGMGRGPRRRGSRPAPAVPPAAPTWAAALTTRSPTLCTQQRCSRVSGNTSRSADHIPSAPSPTVTTGARIPPRLQSRSRSAQLRRLPVAVGDRDQLLGAIGADTDDHQTAQPFLLQPHVEVHPVSPAVHEIDIGQAPVREALPLVFCQDWSAG